MILPDVNVLLYAFRRDADRHADYHAWLTEVVNGDAAYGMSTQALAALVRISTHPRIYREPSTREEALGFCRAVLEPEACTIIRPGARHWPIFVELADRAKAAGNLIQDAWFAALAIESGCEWISTDQDYGRFPDLRWRPPF
ncbi:MAG TPA: type II toxin-antitoxin system VapC family toxin [Vicinamibacterales bacterium]|nr:type II toxin-antitoxin system VapC family toxin [Vicinamibacterales bacterium]